MTLEMNHATTQEGLMRIGKFRKDTTDMHRLRMALTGHISLNRTKHWWQVHLFMITLSTFGGVKDLGRINRMSYSLSVVSGIIVMCLVTCTHIRLSNNFGGVPSFDGAIQDFWWFRSFFLKTESIWTPEDKV